MATGVSCGFSRPKTPRCFRISLLYPTEVSLMHTFFTASDFLPTKWSTADEKAAFGNNLLHFMLTGFLAGRFTEKLYTRLSMCFGYIASSIAMALPKRGLTAPRALPSFVNHLMQWPCHGDPGYTFSDVERAIQREAARLNLVAKVNEAAASSIQRASSPCWTHSKTSTAETPSSRCPIRRHQRNAKNPLSSFRSLRKPPPPHGLSPLSHPGAFPMEFVVKKSDILRELAAVQSATERKTTIPILTNVLLKTDNGSLHIAATDLDCSLRTTCPAAIAKDGTITLPARKLYDYVGFAVMLWSGGAAHGSCVSQV